MAKLYHIVYPVVLNIYARIITLDSSVPCPLYTWYLPYLLNFALTRSSLQTNTGTFVNSADPDETARNERHAMKPSYMYLKSF